MRLDAVNQRQLELPPAQEPYLCTWWRCQPLKSFLATANPGLHGILDPYTDWILLESHGEQFLELFITKAGEEVWREWLWYSLNVAALADRVDVFRRLFALCEHNPELRTHFRVIGLLNTTAMKGNTGVLSALLEMDVFITAVQGRDNAQHGDPSPLTWAAMQGHRGCVAALVKAGAPLEYKWYMGGTALMEAVQNDHEGVVLELLAGGADVNAVNDGAEFKRCGPHHANYTPLGMAVAEDKMEIVEILLAAGAGLGKERTDVHAPVIVAAYWGSCGPLERLLLAGADVNVVDTVGESALHKACYNSQEGAVEILLRYHASPSIRCDIGQPPSGVVAMAALEKRRRRVNVPSTLNVAETAAADSIHAMLKQASAWSRRGWLVMLRTRRVVAGQLPADTEASSTELLPVDHAAASRHDSDTETDLDVVVNHKALRSLEDVDREEKRESPTETIFDGGSGCSGGKPAGAGEGWRCAVEWLLQCPDDRGIFREILGFL